MKQKTMIVLVIACSALACLPALAGDEWKQAEALWNWTFPRDHGMHPGFRTEWWYFTGNLRDAEGNRYGYQLTFFRRGLRLHPSDPDNPWSLRDLYPAHFTITDVRRASFHQAEQISRAGPGLAGAAADRMFLWNLGWSATMKAGRIVLRATQKGMAISLELKPLKPPVLHGERGLSRKGAGRGQASYYYSFTSLQTKGTVQTPEGKTPVAVEGTSWFDHEFSSSALAADQIGWDWFSLHLSDGRDLMIYLLRKKDGTVEKESSGTLVEGDGRNRHLRREDISVEVVGTWNSQKSGGVYPNRWRIRVLPAGIDVELASLVADQELHTTGSTGIVYWEGAAGCRGMSGERPVTGEGYVEMTGYAGTIGGAF